MKSKTLKDKARCGHRRDLKFIVYGLIVSLTIGCNETVNQKSRSANVVSTPAPVKSLTFQEIGFFGRIKKEKWDDFLNAVQNNVAHTRKEKGNLSFSLFVPENGSLQPIWFERFIDKDAHNYHKNQSYFKDAITVIQKSLAETPNSIALKEIEEIPVELPIPSEKGETRHVINLFDIMPGKRQSFIKIVAELTKQSRPAQGNLEFNLYQFADDINKFVLIAGWQTTADYHSRLKIDHTRSFITDTEGFFVPGPMYRQWIVKDLSK